jgi:hypothetical protein
MAGIGPDNFYRLVVRWEYHVQGFRNGPPPSYCAQTFMRLLLGAADLVPRSSAVPERARKIGEQAIATAKGN